MERSIFYVCVFLAVVTVAAARSKNPGERNRNNRDCGEWTYGECVPKRGTCGPGKKPGTRTGEKCKVKERQFRCVLPCPGEEGPSDLAGRTRGRDGRKKNKPVPCRYTRGEWNECDKATGMRTRTLTLKKGDETCERTKTESKKCKAAGECKYQRSSWSECDSATNQRTRTLSLKRGDATTCEATRTETKPCKAANAKSTRCRYQRGQWSECDATTNTRTRMNALKRGGSNCEAKKTETRKCKKACRYHKGEWSECNASGMRQRLDNLKDGSDTSCETTRTVDRKCASSRPQRRRCQFESWGPYSQCSNGVRTRMRKVISGGEECQRRAVKTKPCHD